MKISHTRTVSLAMEMVRTALADPYIYGIQFHRELRREAEYVSPHIRIIESEISTKKRTGAITSFSMKLKITVPFANPEIGHRDHVRKLELSVFVDGQIDATKSIGIFGVIFNRFEKTRELPLRFVCHIGAREQVCTKLVSEHTLRGMGVLPPLYLLLA